MKLFQIFETQVAIKKIRVKHKFSEDAGSNRSFNDWVELTSITASQSEDDLMDAIMNDESTEYFISVAASLGVPEDQAFAIGQAASNITEYPDPGQHGHRIRDPRAKMQWEKDNELGEARGDSLGRKFNKMFWWDGYRDPKDMLATVNGLSDDDLKMLLSKDGWDYTQSKGKGTPRAFQIQIIKRELRRRGHRDFEKYMNEAGMQVNEKAPPGMEDWIKDRKAGFKKQYGDRWEEVLYATAWKQHNANESVNEAAQSGPTGAQHNTMDRLISQGGTLYNKAKLVKGDETAFFGINGERKFAMYPDGTFETGKKFIEFQRNGWNIEMIQVQ